MKALHLERLVRWALCSVGRLMALAWPDASWPAAGRLLCAMLMFSVVAAWAVASEQIVVRFVEHPHTRQNVVRVGDLLEILSGPREPLERLLELPLGPAPRLGERQSWQAADVLRHLELRGLHASHLRWSGATQAELERLPAEDANHSIEPAFVQGRTIELAESLVAQAISEYLNLKTGERTEWNVRATIPPRLADVIRIRRNILGVGGGAAPWLGSQEFVLQLNDRQAIVQVPIQAEISLPPMVVVAKRPLRRDEVLTEEALELAPLPQRFMAEQSKFFSDFAELVGQQLRRSVSTGLPISSEYVGSPTVITRNEMVEVESISGPVAVRTMARSLGSGAVGDLIDIEVVPSKQRMLATVVGPLKVRVAAVSARGGLTQ